MVRFVFECFERNGCSAAQLGFPLTNDGFLPKPRVFCCVHDVARRQQVNSFERRADMSLACLWQQQGKRQDAYDLLAPLYGWFTEYFDTADLQEAAALLEACSR